MGSLYAHASSLHTPSRATDFPQAFPAGSLEGSCRSSRLTSRARHRPDYRLFFGARVRFEQKESCLILDERYLHLPIRRSEAELKAFLREAPSNILVCYRQDSELTTKISDIFGSLRPEY